MSLNWSIKDCHNHKEFIVDHGDNETGLDVVTKALVFACMALGMSEVTTKNIDEFLYRQEFARRCNDYYPMNWGIANAPEGVRPGAHRYFTRAEIVRRVGLTTNVTQITRKAFHANCVRILDEDTKRAVAKQIAEHGEAVDKILTKEEAVHG